MNWIAVKDQLPPLDIPVIGINSLGEYQICTLGKHWINGEQTFYHCGFYYFFPKYWMALPEKPDPLGEG